MFFVVENIKINRPNVINKRHQKKVLFFDFQTIK